MRIKTKLMIGSIVSIAVLLILASAGINNMMILSKQLDLLYKERYQKMMRSLEILSQTDKIAEGIANVLTSRTAESLETDLPLMEQSESRALAAYRSLEQSDQSSLEGKLLSEVSDSMEQYSNYTNEVMKLVQEGKMEEAVDLREREGLGYQKELINKTNQLAEYYRKAMDEAYVESTGSNESTLAVTTVATIIGLLLGISAMLWNMRSLGEGLESLSVMIKGFAKGTVDASSRIEDIRKDEFGEVAKVFNALAEDIERKTEIELVYNKQMEEESWVKSNLAKLVMKIQNDTDLAKVSQSFIGEICPLTGAQLGALYVREGNGEYRFLKLQAAFAFEDETVFNRLFIFGQGLVGECAQDGMTRELNDLPDDYFKIQSGLGNTVPRHGLILPVQYQSDTLAVIELASLRPFTKLERRLLEETAVSLGIVLNNLFGRIRVEELLRESQALSEELQAQSEELMSQQEELRRSNEKLEEHTKRLKKSEELLQSQQEALEQSNEELLQKTHMLELQMKQTEQKNIQVEKTKAALEKQTVQLALSSKYKSEFLTNMSHELRTPLNSLLILSQMLMDNKEGNLTPKQVDFAATIHGSGSDLLKLIDEILDLSKISSGKMDVVIEHIPLSELDLYFRRSFTPVSLQKGISFDTKLETDVPDDIYTDGYRVKQILKNLLSNAFKFTHKGSVSFTIRNARPDECELASEQNKMIAFEVKDTGIGIPENKQQLIFEAFQQADGTTSRVYGGTGLGLAISKELAALLGGMIKMDSTEGKGSTFTLYLPEFHLAGEQSSRELYEHVLESPADTEVFDQSLYTATAADSQASPVSGTEVPEIEDDADRIEPSDKVVLIIEDDVGFAKVLLEIARSRGFKGIVAMQGDKGLSYARNYRPDAILLDIRLPVIDGWTVLNQLKHQAETRHIPVHVISVVDDIQHGLSMGAIAYLKKPADKNGLEEMFAHIQAFLDRGIKQLLIAQSDRVQRSGIVELIGYDDIAISEASTGGEALELLRSQHYDCMVLDLDLQDISGFELLDEMRKDDRLRGLPVIIYTGGKLDKKDEERLKKYAGTNLIKDVKSPERLLDETTLFLHRVEANLPEEKRSMLRKLHNIEKIFEGKQVMIVDDDIRNVFALSSVLESYNMNVMFAENGKEALNKLEKLTHVDLIIMDIMMPEMDGYETMKEIRSMARFENLPIIAVTAKAMKNDRDKCIEAGASDYIAKPVNTEQLLSLMRVWLYQ